MDSRSAPRKIKDFSDCGAKVSIFNFCVCKLKKLANMGVARTPLSQRTIVTASFPVIDESSNRTGKQKLLPCEPILGVRLCAQDGGGLLNEKPRRRWTAVGMEGGPGGNGRADFLWSFLCSATKKGHKYRTAHARSSVRPATKM